MDIVVGRLIAVPIAVIGSNIVNLYANDFEAEWKCGEDTLVYEETQVCTVDFERNRVERIDPTTQKVLQVYRNRS